MKPASFKKFFRLLICLSSFIAFVTHYANAQSLKFEPNEIDFGKIAANTLPPKAVEFINSSDQRLAILVVEKGPNAQVKYTPKFYEPGEKGILAVQYSPRQTGLFEEVISIHTNLEETPTQLKIKGNAVSILECFPDPKNLLKRSIEVIDEESKLPVPNAELSLVHNHKYNNPVNLKVNKEGKLIKELPIGMYNIKGKAEDYEAYTEDRFVPKSMPSLIIEMKALKKAPQSPPPAKPLDPMPEIDQIAAEEDSDVIVTSTDLPENLYAANNLIFLLDISTSMKSGKKFVLLQQSVNNLALILRHIDNVSVITYSTDANVLLSGVTGSDKMKITEAVQNLKPYGITRGVKGLNHAYEIAKSDFIEEGNNQIILMTDGQFSEQGVSDSYYQQLLSSNAARGIKLSIIGFGVNKDAINRMKLMSESGQGSFILVESDTYVKEILIDEVKANSFIGD